MLQKNLWFGNYFIYLLKDFILTSEVIRITKNTIKHCRFREYWIEHLGMEFESFFQTITLRPTRAWCAFGYQSPPSKSPPLSFSPSPLLNLQTVQASPRFSQSWLYNILSLTLSHLSKVTKFLVKITLFKFLVMTKKIFFRLTFLSLKISNFSLFSI